jgi:hypothetical protein
MGFLSRLWEALTGWLPSVRRRREAAEGSMLSFDQDKMRDQFRRSFAAAKAEGDARTAEGSKTPPPG